MDERSRAPENSGLEYHLVYKAGNPRANGPENPGPGEGGGAARAARRPRYTSTWFRKREMSATSSAQTECGMG